MTISMYQASVPNFIRLLRHLATILDKGAAYAETKKIDPAVLVSARLYPDMFPLSRQVQIATDVVKACPARLSGQQPPKFEDNEASFPELLARIEKTIVFLETFKAAQLDGTEGKRIAVPSRNGSMEMDGLPYLMNYVIPNFYFHVTTAYAILRHCGVELGKSDFLGKL